MMGQTSRAGSRANSRPGSRSNSRGPSRRTSTPTSPSCKRKSPRLWNDLCYEETGYTIRKTGWQHRLRMQAHCGPFGSAVVAYHGRLVRVTSTAQSQDFALRPVTMMIERTRTPEASRRWRVGREASRYVLPRRMPRRTGAPQRGEQGQKRRDYGRHRTRRGAPCTVSDATPRFDASLAGSHFAEGTVTASPSASVIHSPASRHYRRGHDAEWRFTKRSLRRRRPLFHSGRAAPHTHDPVEKVGGTKLVRADSDVPPEWRG